MGEFIHTYELVHSDGKISTSEGISGLAFRFLEPLYKAAEPVNLRVRIEIECEYYIPALSGELQVDENFAVVHVNMEDWGRAGLDELDLIPCFNQVGPNWVDASDHIRKAKILETLKETSIEVANLLTASDPAIRAISRPSLTQLKLERLARIYDKLAAGQTLVKRFHFAEKYPENEGYYCINCEDDDLRRAMFDVLESDYFPRLRQQWAEE